MSQHDYNIANGGGAAVRADINNALLAVLSQNSGATAPTTTKPFMMWYDTTTGVLKMRNAADTAWVDAITGVSGGNGLGMVNRIINGDMRIDQRNAGASVTPTGSGYTLDRWLAGISQSGKFSVQRNAGAVTPPAGFTNYLGVTSLSAYSITSSDYFGLLQRIEGFNTSDLGWGTANAQTVTLSFWVRSSLTGMFGGALRNSADNRSYPFSYTISAANTWEQKTITIAGDTTGTWLTDNGVGIQIIFGLGYGSTNSGTAGSWSSNSYSSVTGATSVVGTNGATFYITGVDLRKGTFTSAPAWDWRPYGTELALCQRYYEKSFATGVAPSAANATTLMCQFNNSGGSGAGADAFTRGSIQFKTIKRSAPTVVIYSPTASGQVRYLRNTGATVDGAAAVSGASDSGFYVSCSYTGAGSNADIRSFAFEYTSENEL